MTQKLASLFIVRNWCPCLYKSTDHMLVHGVRLYYVEVAMLVEECSDLFLKNAGTVGQGWRPEAYRGLLSTSTGPSIHVLTVDYRGFGLSTGSPTEEGLILDAIAVVQWAVNVANIPPSRIVLLGHSLGTAVTIAAAEHFVSAKSSGKKEFAGIVLVAGFSDLPTLLTTY